MSAYLGKGFDAFAGAGGFSIAAQQLGIEMVGAANHWPLAVEVHAANHDCPHYCQDLRQFDFSQLEPFDWLFAGPSCQGHSQAGQVGRKHSGKVSATHDQLRGTAWAVVDCLEVCLPKFAIVENVPKFVKWPLFKLWRECIEALGYATTVQVLDASKWGVPQERKRLIVVAVRDGARVEVRDPGHAPLGAATIFDRSAEGWIDIEAMRERPSKSKYKSAKEKARISNARAGGALAWGQHSNYNRWGISPTQPAPTITTVPGFLWWTRAGQYRLWTQGEYAAAQTFPKTYNWLDVNKKDSARLIGNAVPVRLAEGVIREVRQRAL